MCDFDVVAIDPEVDFVAVRFHVSIALSVFDNGADRKTVKRRGERAEDNGWVDRHRAFTPFFGQSCVACMHARVPPQGLEPWTHGLKVRCCYQTELSSLTLRLSKVQKPQQVISTLFLLRWFFNRHSTNDKETELTNLKVLGNSFPCRQIC